MRKYEIVAVMSQSLSDQDIKEELKKYQKYIETNGGTSVASDVWGKRELAFAMIKQQYGTYVCVSFQTENHELPAKVTAQMRLNEGILLVQSHKLSDRVRKVKANPYRKNRSDSDFEISIGDDAY